jgi:hypothetical protein
MQENVYVANGIQLMLMASQKDFSFSLQKQNQS